MDEPLDRIRVRFGRPGQSTGTDASAMEEAEAKPDFEPDSTIDESHDEQQGDDHDEPASSGDGDEPNRFVRIVRSYWHRKLWTLPLTVLVIITAVLAVPASRYPILAFFISRPYSVTVTDSSTGTVISGASVKLGSYAAQTDSKGKATITAPVGSYTLLVSKTYYKSMSTRVLVDVMTSNNASKVQLEATGRQIPVKVVNKITGAPIPEVVLTFANTTAKTDLNGSATVVLPATPATQDATLTVDGYNNLAAKVTTSADAVESVEALPANTFAMVPKGQLFFLSNLSGKLDVVSTNLDGSNRQTVLAGTGSEDRNSTVLLASRDWQYLALLSKRDGGTSPKLFLINTANSKLSTIDSTPAGYQLLGWNGHNFVYVLDNPDVQTWQPNKQTILSYNADSGKSVTLAGTKATGTSTSDAQYQVFNNQVFLGSNLIYSTTWYTYPGNINVTGQQNTLMSVKVDGSGSKTLKSVDAGTLYIGTVSLANPGQIYFSINGATSNYYRLDSNQNITQSSTITVDTVNQTYPTYLLSPSGKWSFWTTVRDGKNVSFVGNPDGSFGNQITPLNGYTPYGWYSDDYLLAQKNGSELYILSESPSDDAKPLKVSDYFKPDYAIYGYGGGYGGF